ncbi:MAG: hypothetical protein GY777_21615 [Candidatus Brocadiaceae bacterium]|nr:hypothetical protein [Candidatus Brocadiaceae bacterium]
MRRKKIYKIPVVEKSFVLDSKYPITEKEERMEEIEKISKESYQTGWDDALKKNRNDVELLCQSLNSAIEDLKCERDNIWNKCEKGIIKLAFAIAKKAVYEELSQGNSKIIENVVNDAISKVKGNKVLSIRVNSDDAKSLEATKTTGLHGSMETYELISDNGITRGGCKVVTDCGSVDAMVETRWNEIVSAFEELDLEMEGLGCLE